MACGCELRGAPARQNSIYLPGVYASLAGLRGLGTAEAPTTNEELRSNLTSLQGQSNLASALRAAGVPEATISTIGTVREVLDAVGGGAELIAGLVSDQGVKVALRWLAFIVTGRNPPGMSDSDVRSLADLCQGSQFLNNPDDVAGLTSGLSGVAGAVLGANAGKTVTDFVSVLLAFVTLFRARLCSSRRIVQELQSRTASSADDAAISAEAIRVATTAAAAARATPTPQQLAQNNFRQALLARYLYENPGPSYPLQWGSRRYTRAEFDCLTSSMLLNSSRAFLEMFPGQALPPVSGRIRISRPQGYINTPPAASCSAPSGPPTGGGGGGGGGAGIAIAGAGLLAALMFFRR